MFHDTQRSVPNARTLRINAALSPVLGFMRIAPLVPVADDPEEFEAIVDPLICLAIAWNAVKLLGPLSSALTASTMPAPQWLEGLSWRQYTQIGVV